MKITETIERECCQPNDLAQYQGNPIMSHSKHPFKFCKHCGQVWAWVRSAGEIDGGLERVVLQEVPF